LTGSEALKAEIKKLSSQAVQAKLNLHDLPVDWEKIPAVAQIAYDTYRELQSKRALLRAVGA